MNLAVPPLGGERELLSCGRGRGPRKRYIRNFRQDVVGRNEITHVFNNHKLPPKYKCGWYHVSDSGRVHRA